MAVLPPSGFISIGFTPECFDGFVSIVFTPEIFCHFEVFSPRTNNFANILTDGSEDC